MADSISFILRNAPVKQLIKGILPVCLSICVLGENSIYKDLVTAKEYSTCFKLSVSECNNKIFLSQLLISVSLLYEPSVRAFYFVAVNAFGFNNFVISKEIKCRGTAIICVQGQNFLDELFRCPLSISDMADSCLPFLSLIHYYILMPFIIVRLFFVWLYPPVG